MKKIENNPKLEKEKWQKREVEKIKELFDIVSSLSRQDQKYVIEAYILGVYVGYNNRIVEEREKK